MRAQLILSGLFLFFLSLALPAQKIDLKQIEKSSPQIKLPTKKDKKGVLQWDRYHQNCPACKGSKKLECSHCKHLEEPKKCPSCKTTRKAACHYCVGKGALPNPLANAPCPGCRGKKLILCVLCANTGYLKIVGGGKKGTKCPVCKGHAGVVCKMCKAKGTVASAFRGKVGGTKLKKLEGAKKELDKLIPKVASFQTAGNMRQDNKRFAALFKKAYKDFPELKKYVSQNEGITKKLNQPQLKENHKGLALHSELSRTNLLAYLLHQSKVLDQCIAREKENAKAPKKTP